MTKIVRVAEGKKSTLSHLYINDIFCCFLLEDKLREVKIPGETAIPEGTYQLKLNNNAGMNRSYRQRFANMHQGMVEIDGIPNFDLVFIHIGNYLTDTSGCPLTGHYWTMANGDYMVNQSALAYKLVYPKLLSQIRAGNTELQVVNQIES